MKSSGKENIGSPKHKGTPKPPDGNGSEGGKDGKGDNDGKQKPKGKGGTGDKGGKLKGDKGAKPGKTKAVGDKSKNKNDDGDDGDERPKKPAGAMKRPAAAKRPAGLKNPRNELKLRPAAAPAENEDGAATRRDARKARKFNLQWKNGTLPDEIKVKLEQAKDLKDTGGYREEVTTIMNDAFDITGTGKVVAKTPVFTESNSKSDEAYHRKGQKGTFRYTLPWGPTTKSPSRNGKVCSYMAWSYVHNPHRKVGCQRPAPKAQKVQWRVAIFVLPTVFATSSFSICKYFTSGN